MTTRITKAALTQSRIKQERNSKEKVRAAPVISGCQQLRYSETNVTDMGTSISTSKTAQSTSSFSTIGLATQFMNTNEAKETSMEKPTGD